MLDGKLLLAECLLDLGRRKDCNCVWRRENREALPKVSVGSETGVKVNNQINQYNQDKALGKTFEIAWKPLNSRKHLQLPRSLFG